MKVTYKEVKKRESSEEEGGDARVLEVK